MRRAMADHDKAELLGAEGVRGACGGDWTFGLRAGEAAWIRDGRDSGMAWLDWLTGIEPPPAGEVRWKGVEWRRRGPGEAAAERGKIGCVFADGGLVANLDMDENVWLPARFHRREGAAEGIERWARHFECWPLPQERLNAVPERMRRRVAWTRAFSCAPELLLLERPLRGAAPEDRRLLLAAVAEARAGGAGVAWVDEELEAEARAALEPAGLAVPEPRRGAKDG